MTMLSERLKKIGLVVLLCGTFIVMFPLSIRMADPIATHVFDPSIDTRVLLVWPDRVELRPISKLNEVSPRPADAQYSFLVPPAQERWVIDHVRENPDHAPDAGWMIRIKQLAPGRQRIQLEIMGDGFWGMVYDAYPDRIVPIGSRASTSPAGAEFG